MPRHDLGRRGGTGRVGAADLTAMEVRSYPLPVESDATPTGVVVHWCAPDRPPPARTPLPAADECQQLANISPAFREELMA
jgi:hypothetical protein